MILPIAVMPLRVCEAQAQEVEIVLRRLHRNPESCQVIHAREACNHILALLAADQMVGEGLRARK